MTVRLDCDWTQHLALLEQERGGGRRLVRQLERQQRRDDGDRDGVALAAAWLAEVAA